MPEGPEIRRAADRLAEVLVGRALHRVRFAFPALQHYQEELAASRVDRVDTRGKALLIHFESGKVIYSHNQLYGRWFVRRAGHPPATRRQLRLSLETEDHWAQLYSASDITVLDDHALGEHPFLARVGPDLLSETPPPRVIADRLESDRFRRRSLGALLLDQSFVAGLGNYLRSEVLFVAGLHPDQRGQDLDRKGRLRLARAVLSLTERSYRTGGITNDPRRAERLKRQGWRRGAYRHHVFGRAGQDCFACGATIVRETVAGRRLYRCSACQPGLH